MGRRSFNTHKKKSGSRRQKPIILIIAEGKNVTESQYFRSLQNKNSEYNIKVLIPGHITDPVGLKERIEKFWRENDMDEEKGDLAFIVLDLDCDAEKAKLIKRLSAQDKISKFVVSNPCFEVWFLLHFRYSTKEYHNSAEVVRDLRNFIPDYEKNTEVSPVIKESLQNACRNAKKLEKYFEELKYDWPSEKCNPRTDVPKIIDAIESLNDNSQ